MPSPEAKLLSVDDLAELCGVPRRTVLDWNSKRTGPPPIRVGKHTRYRPTAVTKWLDSKTA